jgi:ribosomal protein S18 acetylase RimI-like enzyme
LSDAIFVEYLPQYGPELVQMWRASFQKAVGVSNPHPFADHLRFLDEELSQNHSVVLAVDEISGRVIGFTAFTPEKISQLYVHVDHQNRGIGSLLLNIAKENSHGHLRLFTFERNKNAQRFYESHGFKIVARGFEESLQLADIEYEWCAEH